MSYLHTPHLTMWRDQAYKTHANNWKIFQGEFHNLISNNFNKVKFFQKRQMHDEVSETENLRKNLAVERMIVEGCDILLDVNQVFVRQGNQ